MITINFFKNTVLSMCLLYLAGCNSKSKNPDKKVEQDTISEKKDDACFSNLKVSEFDSPWPTICRNVTIKVDRIYNDGEKDILVISRENVPRNYSMGDSIPLYGINQENSMAYIKKILVDSGYARLLIKCNCN